LKMRSWVWSSLSLMMVLAVFAAHAEAQRLTGFTVAPRQVVGGTAATATVTIDVPAPVDGFHINLFSSDSASAEMPAEAVVPEGSQTVSFSITTHGVTVPQIPSLWAYTNYDLTTAIIKPLFVVPAGFSGPLLSVMMGPTIVSGNVGRGTAYINGTAPAAGARVKLRSANARVRTPASILIPAGASTAGFDVTSKPYFDDDVAWIEGTYKTFTSGDFLRLSTINLPEPTGLVATPDSDSVVLRWNRDPYAERYRIEFTNAGETAIVDEINTFSLTTATVRYDDIDAARGIASEYKVIAINAYGESPASAGVSVTPVLRVPAAPTTIQAIGGDNAVALVWSGVPDAVNYKVYRRLATQNAWRFLAASEETRFTDDTAVNGVAYAYAVSGVNTSGEGKKSSPAFVGPKPSGMIRASVETLAALFLQSIGQTVTVSPTVKFPAEPILLNTNNHYANRWKVVYPNQVEMEITDDTNQVVYYQKLTPTVSGNALTEMLAKERGDTILMAAGIIQSPLTSDYAAWEIKSANHFADDSAFWQMHRGRTVQNVPASDHYVNMEQALDGTLLALVVMEPYKLPTSVAMPISETNARQTAEAIMAARSITGLTFDSSRLAIVQSNNTFADPLATPSASVNRVARIVAFTKPNANVLQPIDDVYLVWIDAENGNPLGGELARVRSSRSSAPIAKPKQIQAIKKKKAAQVPPGKPKSGISRKKVR
jgi:hypothetical protein